ncbi:hypothetical protein O3P69_001341 [Scylla paramamosain]|uniref:Uncharacterized protein n=1 Tax=Scylla paramamosain TaxID=85552 RepID=A0AAW0UT22_SCYPA
MSISLAKHTYSSAQHTSLLVVFSDAKIKKDSNTTFLTTSRSMLGRHVAWVHPSNCVTKVANSTSHSPLLSTDHLVPPGSPDLTGLVAYSTNYWLLMQE